MQHLARIYVFRVYGRHWLMCARPVIIANAQQLQQPQRLAQQQQSSDVGDASNNLLLNADADAAHGSTLEASSSKPTSRMQGLTHKLLQRVREEIKGWYLHHHLHHRLPHELHLS